MKILISSRSFGKNSLDAIEMLKEQDLEPIFNPYNRKLTEDELLELIDGSIGIIAGTEKITGKIMKEAKSLKVISRYGIGLDNIDLNTAKKLGIIVKNTPEAPSQAVAELTVGLIFSALRRINQSDQNVKSGQWKQIIGNLIYGKNIGVIGLGRIGKKLSILLEPFQVNILACEPNPDKQFISKHNIKLVSFKEIISKSDIVSLHLPLTDETRNIIGKNELLLMKKEVIIINTSRGGLIDENALIDALENNKIAGAAIDVFEVEPYNGKLKEFNNVILTPHIGSYTKETRAQMELETVQNLITGLREVKIL